MFSLHTFKQRLPTYDLWVKSGLPDSYRAGAEFSLRGKASCPVCCVLHRNGRATHPDLWSSPRQEFHKPRLHYTPHLSMAHQEEIFASQLEHNGTASRCLTTRMFKQCDDITTKSLDTFTKKIANLCITGNSD